MDLSICFNLQHTLCGGGDFSHQRFHFPKLFGHSKGLLRKCLGVLSHLFTYLEIGVSKFKGISSCPKERIRIVKPISVRWNEKVGFDGWVKFFLLRTSLAVELLLACRLPVGRFSGILWSKWVETTNKMKYTRFFWVTLWSLKWSRSPTTEKRSLKTALFSVTNGWIWGNVFLKMCPKPLAISSTQTGNKKNHGCWGYVGDCST